MPSSSGVKNFHNMRGHIAWARGSKEHLPKYLLDLGGGVVFSVLTSTLSVTTNLHLQDVQRSTEIWLRACTCRNTKWAELVITDLPTLNRKSSISLT